MSLSRRFGLSARSRNYSSWPLYFLFLSFLFLPLPSLAQDTDGDGMPDSYETAYGCLMPDTVDANVDYDGDGMTSLDEYL
ncbi:MAG TPA: hypothetical protein VM658_12840 [bacterium]|nr:hypothetical protein [bacterium]